ncbi:hypothetical protein GobsT_51310 [Gemmata obscuriglobus]|nr:hypothetical protein GobsT_51310 [Gemmata obscuriglobus]VTS09650.1 ---NA--- : [Gemmata obscuriglobus UQM 2246]
MICRVCEGASYLLFLKLREYWHCPCCGGAGVSVQHGPSVIGPGTRRRKKS